MRESMRKEHIECCESKKRLNKPRVFMKHVGLFAYVPSRTYDTYTGTHAWSYDMFPGAGTHAKLAANPGLLHLHSWLQL